MEILSGQELKIQNLISFRKNAQAPELGQHTNKLLAYINEQGANRTGGNISAKHNMQGGILDIEMFFPIDKEIPSTEDFVFVAELHLQNCVKITHKGNPQLLQGTAEKLKQFIQSNEFTTKPVSYMVMVNEITDPKDIDLFEMDLYMPVA